VKPRTRACHRLHEIAAGLLCSAFGLAQAFTLSTDLGRSTLAAAEAKNSPTLTSSPSAMARHWPALLARLDQSADARAAEADAQASAALSRQQWSAAWMPRLDAAAGVSRQSQIYNGANIRTPSNNAQLVATLPVWRPAERAAANAQASTAAQARWQARSRQLSLAQELSQAWLDAAEAAEQQRLTQDHLQLLDGQLAANERRLNAGLGTVLDPLETRTRQAQMQAQADQLASRLRSQALTLERLAGPGAALPQGLSAWPATGAAPAPLASSLLLAFSPAHHLPPLDEALLAAADRHPALQEARASAQAAQETTRARSAEAWQPTVDATASASRSRETRSFEGVSEQQKLLTRAVGLQLNWPLFSGGVQTERQSEATAQLTAAQARADAAQSRLDNGLRDAYQRLAQAQSRQARLATLVDTAQATQDAVAKAWSAGLRSHTDLLNAQQALFEARLSLASARVAALQAGVDALAWLDMLDAEHIAPWLGQFDLKP
jgi:outer membrane protein